MPRLEEISFDYITDTDIKECGGHWVCTGLRKLTATIVLLEEGTQGIVLDLLGSLKDLTELNLATREMEFMRQFCDAFPAVSARRTWSFALRLSLDQGLDKLKMLNRLEVITGLSNHLTLWRESEARWVLRHWV